jgi:hypothetical protein
MAPTADEERDEAAADAAVARERAARARARAYLDLWESHVVQTTLHGPVTRPVTKPETAWRARRS